MVLDVPGERETAATHDLVFLASNLSALATEIFFAQKQDADVGSRSELLSILDEGLVISKLSGDIDQIASHFSIFQVIQLPRFTSTA